jgi:hypothetical protein
VVADLGIPSARVNTWLQRCSNTNASDAGEGPPDTGIVSHLFDASMKGRLIMTESKRGQVESNRSPQSNPAPPSQPSDAPSRPLKRISFGRIHATVWKRHFSHGQQNGVMHDISICRKYQDGSGNWRESHTFSAQDLPCIRMVISGALRFLKLERDVNAGVSPARSSSAKSAPTNPSPSE